MKKILLIFIILIFTSENVLATGVTSQFLLEKKKEILLKYVITQETFFRTSDTKYFCFLSKRFLLKNNSPDSIKIIDYNYVDKPQTTINFNKITDIDLSDYEASLFLLALLPPFGLIYLTYAIAATPFKIAMYTKQLSEYKKHYIKPFTKVIKPGNSFRFNTLQPYSCEQNSSGETCKNIYGRIEINVLNLSTNKIYRLTEPDVEAKRSVIYRQMNLPGISD